MQREFLQHTAPCLNCWLPPLVPLALTYLCQSQININIETRYVCMTLCVWFSEKKVPKLPGCKISYACITFSISALDLPRQDWKDADFPWPLDGHMKRQVCHSLAFPLSRHPLPWRGLLLRVECLACGHIIPVYKVMSTTHGAWGACEGGQDEVALPWYCVMAPYRLGYWQACM